MLEKRTYPMRRPGHIGVGVKGPQSANSSRSVSPHTATPASFIPQPRGVIARERIGLDKNRSRPSSASSSSSISHLPVKTTPATALPGKNTSAFPTPSSQAGIKNYNSNSMLDKFKFFNSKDKSGGDRNKGTSSSKRTSSSSGFSSARSERSDSSTSLCSESKTRSNPDAKDTSPSSTSSASSPTANHSPTSANTTPIGQPRNSLKKIVGASAAKQIGNKSKTCDGKDTTLPKLDHPKSNPSVTKEKKNEKALKSLDNSAVTLKVNEKTSDANTSNPNSSVSNKGLKVIPSLSSVSNISSSGKIKEDTYTKIEPDNPIRQSKVIGNLKNQSQTKSQISGASSSSNLSVEASTSPVTQAVSMDSTATSISMENQGFSQNNMLIGSPGSGNSSSIPKPTAAVKGTSKVSKDDKRNLANSSGGQTSIDSHKSGNPINHQLGTKLHRDDIYVAVHIAGPDTQVIDPGQRQEPQQVEMRASSITKSDRSRSERANPAQSGVSVAMVSPIMSSSHRRDRQNQDTNANGSLNRDQQNHSRINKKNHAENNGFKSSRDISATTNGPSFNLRGQPEPIYETCEKLCSRDRPNCVTNEATGAGEEGDDVVLNIKPMQPLLRASPYGYMRSFGPLNSQRAAVSARMHSSLRIHTEYGETGKMSSSRQFLASLDAARMYNMAMKRALAGSPSIMESEYESEMDSFDLASGYLSDGEILRPGITSHLDDIGSGYLSEGGAPVYTRKPVSKQKENPKKDSPPRTIDVLQDDRSRAHSQRHFLRLGFDDSSSISSGVSDTFPELSTDDNLTGSSLSSDTNVYSSLKRNPRNGSTYNQASTSTGKSPSASVSSSADKGRRSNEEQTVHPSNISGGNKTKQAHVKKTDSSMQTDSSAFHHASSTVWKRYLQQQQNCADSNQSGKDSRAEKVKEKKSGKSEGSRKGGSSEKNDSQKPSKHKLIVVRSAEVERHRVEGDSNDFKGGSQRSALGRSVSPKSSRGSSESLQTAGSGTGRLLVTSDSSKKSSSRSGVSTATSFKRTPPGTSSSGSAVYLSCNGGKNGTSSSGSSKSATKRSPAEKLADVNKVSTFDSPSSKELSNSQTADIANNFSASRQSSAPSAITKNTLERKGKVKVCANTQTTGDLYSSSTMSSAVHSDSEYSSLGRKYPPKQYFMTTPGPGTGLKERVYGNRSILNGSPTPPLSDYVMLSARTPRLSAPLRDIDNYATLDQGFAGGHYSWLRHSSSCGSSVTSTVAGNRNIVGSTLTEADSMESLSSTSSSIHAQGGNRYMFPLSPGTPSLPTSGSSSAHTNGRSSMSPYMTGLLSKMTSKDDDIHGSALSLVSTSSSIYSTAEEKQAHEIRKLKRELDQAHEKVSTLTSQLSTNAHMVAAFEQSLSNMTSRLQHLTASAEQKDSELTELRKTIDDLKKQSAEAGLTKMALQSMQAVQRTLQEHRISRQFSTDSMSSVNSYSSACSGNSGQSGDALNNKKKKKKGWLRSSFSKAFSRSKKNKNGSVSDVEDLRQLQSDSSTPNSPLLGAAHLNGGSNSQPMKQSHSSSALYDKEEENAPEVVKELKKQLREKDMMLTDIRLDALSSAHQLESLKETVNKMRNEMSSLKNDNDRLQRLVSTKSLASSQSSLPHRNSVESLEKRYSASEQSETPSVADSYMSEVKNELDGKMVTVSVYLGCHGDSSIYMHQTTSPAEVLIGSISVSPKTRWDLLDNLVKRTFKEYVLRVDPVSNLGLNAESVVTYHVGEVIRSKDADVPELLPCGYLVGDNMNIRLVLKGTKQHSVDALAFESLIPKSIVQRYVSLLTDHRRIILCGPSGTGKTYIAQKLAEYLVLKNGKELTAGAIATFSVDHKSAKELRQYLSNVADQCETSNSSDLPAVIILDNLHHVGALGEVFNGFLSSKYQKCPYIIGTMNQATCYTTNLQLHHNFRWVLCANHMEPVKGFLGRYLKRKLVEEEIKTAVRNPDVAKVIDWMPNIWQHLNKYLETHSSSDVTIGPRLFLSCPVGISSSQVWFTDLWNYSIVPYLLEAVREGLQLYGRRAAWEDPAEWVHQTYPWPSQGSNDWPQLLRLRPEDVGYEGHPGPGMGSKNHHSSGTDAEADPLLNMLMRLQEAASYSSPHSNDSDSTSMDSHSSGLHSDDLLNTGLESTL